MTIEIGSNRRVLEEEVRNRTKFENRRVLVPVYLVGLPTFFQTFDAGPLQPNGGGQILLELFRVASRPLDSERSPAHGHWSRLGQKVPALKK